MDKFAQSHPVFRKKFWLAVVAMTLSLSFAGATSVSAETSRNYVAKRSGCSGFDANTSADTENSGGAWNRRHRNTYWRHMRCLDLNQTQVIGTHNSYKQAIPPPLLQTLGQQFPELALGLEYSHAPLTDQLDDQGVRQIEIDVYHDPEGGTLCWKACTHSARSAKRDAPGAAGTGLQGLAYQRHRFQQQLSHSR